MKGFRRLSALLMSALLLFSSVEVYAAPAELNLSKPDYSVSFKGKDTEFVIPWTGNYTFTVAGSQAGTNGAAVNKGTTVTFTKYCKCGDVVRFDCGNVPTSTVTENGILNVNGGNQSILYYNDTLLVQAKGGSATTKNTAVAGVNFVRVFDSDNVNYVQSSVHHHCRSSGLSDGTLYTTSNPGGCYKSAGHTHDKTGTCSKTANYEHSCDGGCGSETYTAYDDYPCYACNIGSEHNPGPCRGHVRTRSWHSQNQVITGYSYSCGSPTNTWKIGCGYAQHEIRPVPTIALATSSYPTGATVTNNSNVGNGCLTITLNECNTLYTNNVLAKQVYYLGTKYNVVICNDTVVYYKKD